MEDLAKVVTEATYASEFRYRNPLVEENTVVVAISQSGETADTLAALREAKEKGALALGVVNVVGSHDRPRDRRRHLPPRRPGDRRRQHQGVHLPVRRADDARRCTSAGGKFMSQAQCQEMIDGLCAIPEQMREGAQAERRRCSDIARAVLRPRELAVPRPRVPLPGRAGRRAEAEGNQLHPRRGHARRRDEARPDRADQRGHAGRVHRDAGHAVRQGDQQHRRSPRPRRRGHRRRHRRRHAASAATATTSSTSPTRSSRSSRC